MKLRLSYVRTTRVRVIVALALPVLMTAALSTVDAAPAAAAGKNVPAVSGIAPARGGTAGGMRVTVTGRNFSHVVAVRFGAARGTKIKVLSTRKLTVITPAHAAGTVGVRVTTRSGQSPTTARDRFTYLPLPGVARLAPGTGAVSGGTVVTLTGANFTSVRSVLFGTSRGKAVHVVSSRKLRVTVPAHRAGRVDVRVVTAAGTSPKHASDRFTYVAPVAPPSVTGLSPQKGPQAGGTVVTVTGTNLTSVRSVLFGTSRGKSVQVLAPRKLRVTAPAHRTGSVDVRVVTAAGTSPKRAADRFTYLPSPTVTGLSPQKGPQAGGTRVTVTGTNFTLVRSVTFGASKGASVKVLSPTSLKVTAPAGQVGIVDVQVTTANGSSPARAADQFTYFTPVPTGKWGTAKQIDPAGGLTSVSCASNQLCVAVEHGPDAVVYDGTRWSAPQQVANGIQLTSVSCATGTFCLATDDAGNGYVYNGASWSPTSIAPGDALSGASCASGTTTCAVIDDTLGTVFTEHGDMNFTNDGAMPAQSGQIVSLSCQPAYCFAVDQAGDFATLTIGSPDMWGFFPALGQSGFEPASLSCPRGQGFGGCVVAGSDETVVTWSDASGNWVAQTLGTGSNTIDSVSCTDDGLCMAIDTAGEVASFANGTWSGLTSIGLSGTAWSGVSCSSASFCVGADDQGWANKYTP